MAGKWLQVILSIWALLQAFVVMRMTYNGAWINLEAKYHLDGKGSNVFAFLDAGRLSGDSPYKDKSLGSVGIGASWRPVDWLMSSATISFPFKRNVGSEHVSKARFDFVINAVW